MNNEFPVPDARLAGKVKIVQYAAQRNVLRVATSDGSRNGIEHLADACGEMTAAKPRLLIEDCSPDQTVAALRDILAATGGLRRKTISCQGHDIRWKSVSVTNHSPVYSGKPGSTKA